MYIYVCVCVQYMYLCYIPSIIPRAPGRGHSKFPEASDKSREDLLLPFLQVLRGVPSFESKTHIAGMPQ